VYVPFAPPVIIHTFRCERARARVRVPDVGGVGERQDGDLFHGQPQQVGAPTARAVVVPADEVLITHGQRQCVYHAVHERCVPNRRKSHFIISSFLLFNILLLLLLILALTV